MKLHLSLFFTSLIVICFAQNPALENLKQSDDVMKERLRQHQIGSHARTEYVDPFIGTGGHGHTYPGASAPFGMIQLSPDTRIDNWDGCSGYHYSDSIIYGFSHTHLNGVGVPDYCDLLIVPQCGEARTTPSYKDPEKGYGHLFSHCDEKAKPAYYEVQLRDQEINVRLTVTERAGLHEYTFLNSKKNKYILIDLDHRDKVLDAGFTIENDHRTVSGFRYSNSWATNQKFFFQLQTSVDWKEAKLIKKNGQHKLLLSFPKNTTVVSLRVGISSVDEEGALNNLSNEIPDFNFNRVLARTTKMWEKELSKIQITAESEVMKNFYTALYHAFLQPNIFSDIDGRYRGRDDQIHRIDENSPQYTVFSLWDTYRATHPLYTLVQQKRTTDFIQTFLRQFDQSGDLPVWELAGNETDCMIGYHSVSVISDAYLKGIGGYDAKKALNAMIETANKTELGKSQFRKQQFISSGDEPESVSKTLEYAYDDYCIGAMAEKMGSTKFGPTYLKSSFNFINLLDPQTKFMRARRGAMWYSPFEPSEVNFNYTEANSYQYSLYAPHAVDILSELLGGKDSLEHWLDRLFTTNNKLSGREQADITGLIGQYAHGNEPSHHMAYLYNYTNSPHKTQFYVDKILNELYNSAPDGLSGNEDCGQMSAWYVLSSLGFYQVCPGKPFYDFGRPMMDMASLKLENGNVLDIKTVNNSIENKYIQSIKFNGESYFQNGITHEELMQGGQFVFTMGPKPSENKWKHPGSALKIKDIDRFGFVPAPFLRNEQRIFDDSIVVSIGTSLPKTNCKIETRYRFADEPDKTFSFDKPITLKKSTQLEFMNYCLYTDDFEALAHAGPWISASFIKRDPTIHLKLGSQYSHQYSADGPNSLIDGIQGGNEFRTGEFQGYWAQDLMAEVTFDSARVLSEIGISCLQDMKSWIFYPSEIQIEVSYDGDHYESLQKIVTNVSFASNATTPEMIPNFSTYVPAMKNEFYRKHLTEKGIKKIRITAKNYGKCPSWHLGAGNDTWLFADELIFR
jgi:predicted alpha-1,2-mannosidase